MKTVERKGASSEAYTHHYPQVRGGQCEFCGVLDQNVPAEYQYKLCPHFRGMGELACSYCPDHANPVEVVRNRTLNVHQSPTNPNEVVVVCGSFECAAKHLNRFRINN